jgi:homoserine kinase type II
MNKPYPTVMSTDLEVVAAVYGWKQAHDLWHYEALYLEGNQRVRSFFQPGPFVPFAQRWAALKMF